MPRKEKGTFLTYSLRRALTSSHIFFRSDPLGPLPLTPLPFPDRIPSAASNSFFTSLARAAYAFDIKTRMRFTPE